MQTQSSHSLTYVLIILHMNVNIVNLKCEVIVFLSCPLLFEHLCSYKDIGWAKRLYVEKLSNGMRDQNSWEPLL